MLPTAHQDAENLTDGTTHYWKRVFPTVWTVLVGAVVALIWADALGDAAAPVAVKWVALGMWGGLSTLFHKMFGALQEVWLDGDELLIGDPVRGTRVHLREVREVKESRFTQVKTVTLKLARPTPVGDSVTFVPRGLTTFFFPLSSSRVVDELEARRAKLLPPAR